MPTATDPQQLLDDIKAGANDLVGPLLEQYRSYLKLIARYEVGRRLQGKLDASDLVQETFMDAHKAFPRFQGGSEAQFVHWLRAILAGKLANHVRHYFGTQARDARLERQLEMDLDQSSRMIDRGLMSIQASPSGVADAREQGLLLASALDALQDDYREVLVLRHFEELTFPQVAERMNRTVDSVQKLWIRALAKLKEHYGAER